MGIVSLASAESAYRGYDYFKNHHVKDIEKEDDMVYSGTVAGSNGAVYDVFIDIEHPRKSRCNCPHAAGRRVVCKHMVALYFTAFPKEAEQYMTELEAYWKEEEKWQEELEERLIKCVRGMKKEDLQEALLQVLFEGPEWVYDRFVREYVE